MYISFSDNTLPKAIILKPLPNDVLFGYVARHRRRIIWFSILSKTLHITHCLLLLFLSAAVSLFRNTQETFALEKLLIHTKTYFRNRCVTRNSPSLPKSLKKCSKKVAAMVAGSSKKQRMNSTDRPAMVEISTSPRSPPRSGDAITNWRPTSAPSQFPRPGRHIPAL